MSNVGYLKFLRSFDELTKKTKSFAIVGEDQFFKMDTYRELHQKLRKRFDADEEHLTVDGRTKLHTVEELLSGYPFIGRHRLVSIFNLDKLKDYAKLKPLFQNPTPDTLTITVFTEDMKAIPEDAYADIAVVCNDMNVESKEFDKYLDYCLQNTQKTLSSDARQLIKERYVNNVYLIRGELEKASAYVEPQQEITATALNTSLTIYPTAVVFDIVNAVIKRQIIHSFYLLEDLFNQGIEPPLVIHLLTQRLQLLLYVLRAQLRGENLKDYFIRKKIPLFQFAPVMEGLRSLKEFHLHKYFNILCEKEYQVRMAVGDKRKQRLVMEGLVIEMCR